jgi:hypothetical protein
VAGEGGIPFIHFVDFYAHEGTFVPQGLYQLAVRPGVEPLVEDLAVVQPFPKTRQVPHHHFPHASADALTKEVGDRLM